MARDADSQLVTPEEARTVATNWIAQILHCQGKWGDAATAVVVEVREFKLGEQLLGYFCRVEPLGYIIVSLRRQLEPVKAYAESSDLNPDANEGLADVIKGGMERILDAVEKEAGPIESAPAQDVQRALEIDYRSAWERLELPVDAFRRTLASGAGAMDDCQSGGVLVTSTWDQDPPYNDQCPDMGCYEYSWNGRAKVGCMATAAAQIMRYWCWPPWGVDSPYNDFYDWPNMPDTLEPPPAPAWQQTQAVAELCSEVGLAGGVDYGCKESGGPLGDVPLRKDMLDAYEDHFRYDSGAVMLTRGSSTPADTWFAWIRNEIDQSRPIQYRIDSSHILPLINGHSMVVDGWRISGGLKQYHVNYGWGDDLCGSHDCNCWYTLDSLHGSENVAAEMMLVGLKPVNSLGTWLSAGQYLPPSAFPYRYFDRDARGEDVLFDAGNHLQFRQGVQVLCNGTRIAFYGWSNAPTYLYSQAVWAKGIRIDSGHVYLFLDGGIRMY